MNEKMKVYISVDMEGICGVTKWHETNRGEADYEYFRSLMTREASAAVEGALAAGAAEVLVRDAHDSACNILPDELHPQARLVRNWSGGLLAMMEGLDATYSAAVFIGYHAKAHTRNAILKHTMSLGIADMRVNGVSLPEAGWNALIAGVFQVPVVFVSGDEALCRQANALLGHVDTLAVKEAIGAASVNRSPAWARENIALGVKNALLRLGEYKPYDLGSPYEIEIEYRDEEAAERGSWYPGARRLNDTTVAITVNDFFDALRFYHFVG
ncbi:MAG TPA: M55 family metallopeptidase [Bacillota bacterium]|nr:M55 family metallopeptidase [Bacillota bacterium]